jgi:phosphoglycerate dehydrogenase-like enzyme
MVRVSVVHTVAWEDADWARLHRIGEVSYHPGYPGTAAQLGSRIGEADIVVGADVTFSAEVIQGSPNLAMISLWSTGYDNVDLRAAKERQVIVSNVPGYAAYSVAEHTWAMVLHLAKKLADADAHVRSGQFDWSAVRGIELYEKTVGIVGTGAIGTQSARIARGFGCPVLAYTQHPGPARAERLGVTYVSLPELLARSDIILLHVSLTDATRYMIDDQAFRQMERRPILINTARGDIIEPHALVEAVETEKIRGLGLDVMWEEPPDWDSPFVQSLLASDRVLLSPHCGSHTGDAFRRLTRICLDNIEAFLAGAPANVIPDIP